MYECPSAVSAAIKMSRSRKGCNTIIAIFNIGAIAEFTLEVHCPFVHICQSKHVIHLAFLIAEDSSFMLMGVFWGTIFAEEGTIL